MPFTASSGQVAATPTQTTPPSTTVVSSGLLISGATFGAAQVATADEITFVGIGSGTLSNDCTLQVQVSVNGGTNYGVAHTFTNAQLTAADGYAATVKVGLGNTFRVRFVPGTTTGAGNGVTTRWRL